MLGKLFKYDFKWMSKVTYIYALILIVISISLKIVESVDQTFLLVILDKILVSMFISCIVSILLTSSLRIWVRFINNFYKDESYLTHTLPVTKNELFNSKVLAGICSLLLSVFVIVACLALVFINKESLESLKFMWNSLTATYNSVFAVLYVIGLVVLIILEIIYIMMSGVLGITIGHRSNNYKMIKSLVVGLVSYGLLSAMSLGVIAIVGGIAMFSTSTLFATLSTILFTIAYLFISYYTMELFNLWIPVVMPVIAIALAFTLSLLAKYLMKSRDFEYQYKLATIDGLTELYNHRYFQDTLKQQIEISRRYNQPVSLIICDIDFFKKFNDTYGHQAGDAVLRQVAQTLKKNSRTTDFVCRYGGEEMSIILPNTKAEEALMLANRICAAVSEKPFHLTPVDTAPVTISLGVSTFPDNAQTPQDLIEWADKGLYYAKEHGRNQVGRY